MLIITNKPYLSLILIHFFFLSFSTDADVRSQISQLTAKHPGQTGAYILDKGQDALVARAWLTEQASKSIDVQYFIWSIDPVGILATEALLTAAERGVQVRVIVDDFLLNVDQKNILALDAHPNIEIKIYNPVVRNGVSTFKKYFNLLTNFKKFNQRMHDKTFIVDQSAGITGGRNMADEYFDYDQKYTFRDRDVLLVGKIVKKMTQSFELYWNSEQAISVSQIYPLSLSKAEVLLTYRNLQEFAHNPDNYPLTIKEIIKNQEQSFWRLIPELQFVNAKWLFDLPGKSKLKTFSGLGHSTSQLMEILASAKETILIQSPYLVFDNATLLFFKKIIDRGVSIKLVTNSLESTDNLAAFSGYHKKRKQLLKLGIKIFEFKASPKIEEKLMQRFATLKEKPIFAIHAKSLVVDQQTSYIGTFNLDPRSINLNTEVGVLINNQEFAKSLASAIEEDMQPENSYDLSTEYPDGQVTWTKRLKLWFYELLPIQKLL